jgi:tetratricopeptide (TPR) repeat protein
MDAKFEQTASHRAFAADVALAVEVARAEEPPNLLQEVHGRLIYVTLASLATKAPPEALGALPQVGQVSRALSFASLIRDQERQFQAYRLIGEALVSRGEMEHARAVFKQALTIVGAMSEDGKASALAQIAPGLATMEGLSRVTVIADAMGDQYLRAKALSCIAQSLAQVEQMDKAAEIAARALSEIEKIEDEATTLQEMQLGWLTLQSRPRGMPSSC